MPNANERRKSPRAPAELDLKFDVAGQAGVARLRDISASGVRCTTDRSIPLMTQVGLVIVLPTPSRRREIVCRGAVVRSGPLGASGPGGRISAYETAIFFTDIRDEDRIEVGEFVSAANRSTEL